MTRYTIWAPPDYGGPPSHLTFVRREADGAIIPSDPDNKDWQEYLSWVADGNAAFPPGEAPVHHERRKR